MAKNLKLTSSTLALVLSANGAGAASSADLDVVLANHVDSSYQKEGPATFKRRTEQSQSQLGANKYRDVAEKKGMKPDVGVLGGRKGRRGDGLLFGRVLQSALAGEIVDEGEEKPCPYPDTCEPNLCQCVSNDGNKAFDCASELNAVCKGFTDANGKNWTISGCVYGKEAYYQNIYCPFAECIVGGGTYEACDCGFYEDFCETYKEHPKYNVQDYARTALFCAVHECCKTKDDDEGRASCIEDAPTSMPSMMPSGPTPNPTTGTPTVTKPTSPPTNAPSPPPGSPPTKPDVPTNTPPSPVTPPASKPDAAPSSACTMPGIMGITTTLVAAIIVSLVG